MKRMRSTRFTPDGTKSKKRISVKMAAIALFITLFSSAKAENPDFYFSQMPPLGQSGYAQGHILWDGLTASNTGQYAVIAMLHAIWTGGSGYYVKPYDNNYLNAVDADGRFSIRLTTGGIDNDVDEVIFYFVERARITNVDVANPTTMAGKYLSTMTVFRSKFIPPLEPPTSNIRPGFVSAGTQITLSCPSGGQIRYTVDGSNPVTSVTANLYNNQALIVPSSEPLLIKATTRISNVYSMVSSLLWMPVVEPKDSSFWGLNVSLALNGERFGFRLTEAVTRERMAPVAQLTKWVRTFGTINNGQEFINKIAKESGLRTMIGLYITNDVANNNAQIEGLQRILQMGPAPDLIAIGNETSLLEVKTSTLSLCIDAVRDMVLKQRLKIPIGSVDIAGRSWNPFVLEKLDFIGVNIYHGVWDNTPDNQMISLSKQTYRNSVSAFPTKLVLLTEIGAPYSGDSYTYPGTPGGTQTASIKKATDFLSGFLKWIKEERIPSFYFEAFDEPAKSQNGGHKIEQYFGVMDGHLHIHPFYQPYLLHLSSTGHSELILPELQFYPNPFTGSTRLQGAEGCTLTVFAENGITVHRQQLTSSDELLHLTHLLPGHYFFQLEKDGKSKTVKALKL